MPTIYPRSSARWWARFALPTLPDCRLICLPRKRRFRTRSATNQHDGKSLLISRNSVNPSPQKYSASVSTQITGITPPVPPDERALANVTNARWDAVDADGATDVRARGVR